MRYVLFLLGFLSVFSIAHAQVTLAEGHLFYAIEDDVRIFAAPDSSEVRGFLQRRDVVLVQDSLAHWMRIEKQDGTARGYVATAALSNVWIRISKSERRLFLYRGTQLVLNIPADMSQTVAGDKERQGSKEEPEHWRTPEGEFFICRKNPESIYYKALVLNYPTAEDAERGLRDALITEAEYDQIVDAEAQFTEPPMHTALGGLIEIHGNGTKRQAAWTRGCIAILNAFMDQIWDWVHVGTPVLIEG